MTFKFAYELIMICQNFLFLGFLKNIFSGFLLNNIHVDLTKIC